MEHPILFSTEMVKAILEGRKTQTRRVIKPNHNTEWLLDGSWSDDYVKNPDNYLLESCPYGQPGDRLRLKSTWAVAKDYDHLKPSQLPNILNFWSLFDGTPKPDWCGKSRPGRFLPKKLYYLMPEGEVVNVRVERVQDITEHGAKEEGWPADKWARMTVDALDSSSCGLQAIEWFHKLWDSTNAKCGYGWDVNPWVWVVEFRRI